MNCYRISKAPPAHAQEAPPIPAIDPSVPSLPSLQHGVFQVGIPNPGETFTASSSWSTAQPPPPQPQPLAETPRPKSPWTQNRLAMQRNHHRVEPEDSTWGQDATRPAKVQLTPKPKKRGTQLASDGPPQPRHLSPPAKRRLRPRRSTLLFRPLHRPTQPPDEATEAKFLKSPLARALCSDRMVHVAIGALILAACLVVPGFMKSPPQVSASLPVVTDGRVLVDRTASRQVLERFLSATAVPELLATIRNSGTQAPAVQAWLTAHDLHLPLGGKIIDKGNSVDVASHHLMEFIVQRSSTEVSSLAIMETPAGWRVDWNSFTQQGDMSVADFLTQRPATPVMLFVLAQPDGYFNFDYSDSDQYHCLKLSDNQHAATSFYGYVAKSNPLAPLSMRLTTVSKFPQRPIPLAIHARFTGPATSPPQVEITRVLQDGWFDL